MLELGQPLHAFDAAHVGPGGILVRQAAPGEQLLALDGRTYRLTPQHLVIARADDRLAEGLAGVMGGEESGVTARTRNIILESAYFAPAGIRRTSRELGLASDASYRFERGVDPAGVLAASRRAEDLLLQICGGESRGVAQAGELPGSNREDVTLRLARCRQVLGAEIAQERVEKILTGFGLEKTGGNELETDWRVPSYRADLAREIDLIEEVARVYGLDNVAGSTIARFAPSSPTDRAYDFLMGLRRRLVGLGFVEARSGSLVRADPASGGVPLKNPVTEDGAVLRGTLLPGLLGAAGRNVRLGSGDLRLFEIGRVFSGDIPLGEPEPWMLALVMTGSAAPATWRSGAAGGRATDLHDLRGVVEALAGAVDRLDLRTIPPGPERKDQGALALLSDVEIDGKSIGRLGQLSPGRAKELELRGDVLVAELRVAALREFAAAGRGFAPLARFPSVTRDLAIVVDRALAHGEIAATLEGAREPLLSALTLFDVFTDEREQIVM